MISSCSRLHLFLCSPFFVFSFFCFFVFPAWSLPPISIATTNVFGDCLRRRAGLIWCSSTAGGVRRALVFVLFLHVVFKCFVLQISFYGRNFFSELFFSWQLLSIEKNISEKSYYPSPEKKTLVINELMLQHGDIYPNVVHVPQRRGVHVHRLFFIRIADGRWPRRIVLQIKHDIHIQARMDSGLSSL